MFFLLLLLWILFNARVTLEIVLVGIGLSALLTAFGYKICGWNLRAERIGLRISLSAMCYVARLFVEIIKSNISVLKIILSPDLKGLEPQLFFFDTKLKSEAAKTALANSITITPGTYTIGIYDSTFAVHALNADFAEGTPDSPFNRQLIAMEARTEQNEPVKQPQHNKQEENK